MPYKRGLFNGLQQQQKRNQHIDCISMVKGFTIPSFQTDSRLLKIEYYNCGRLSAYGTHFRHFFSPSFVFRNEQKYVGTECSASHFQQMGMNLYLMLRLDISEFQLNQVQPYNCTIVRVIQSHGGVLDEKSLNYVEITFLLWNWFLSYCSTSNFIPLYHQRFSSFTNFWRIFILATILGDNSPALGAIR